MLTIGAQKITPPLLLAPMMDITGFAFRNLIRQYGGCGLLYSEMLSSRRVPKETDHSPIFKGFATEDHLMLQLLGNDPKCLSESIKRLEAFNPFGFDLNMGCSRVPIMRQGWGAALLSDVKRAAQVVAAMRKTTEKPLTVKLRIAWQEQTESETFLRMLENEGVDAVIVHARTPEKIFTRPAKWGWISEVKAKLNIPVIGNGDVFTAQQGLEMLEQTQCDAIMLGRGAIARPTLFREIMALLEKKPLPPAPGKLEIFNTFVKELGESIHSRKRTAELKTFCEYFAQGLPVPHWFWGPIQGKQDAGEIVEQGRSFLERNQL
ncbi:tRNA-dihydrouridine synthase family protein [bacterium]|nr:tRNA-dihydrouridine synthase family protein [bacterium]